jgi:hypothetical protein
MDLLYDTSTTFLGGLPTDIDLQSSTVARVFRVALHNNGFLVESDVQKDGKDVPQTCFHRGWLHADKLPCGYPQAGDVGYFFPTSLHCWYVEWMLGFKNPSPPSSLDTDNLQTFVFKVISKFSPRLLAYEQRIGPGCIQRPLEAQYHDEFYCTCHILSNGSVVSFPELGTVEGQIDFYILPKEWGIELLREGNGIEEHSSRFSTPGSYATILGFSDYIILYFRISRPRNAYQSMCI